MRIFRTDSNQLVEGRQGSFFLVLALAFAGLISTQCLAASGEVREKPAVVQASGQARIVADSDRVQVDLTVVSQAMEASEAVAMNAQASEAVQAKLRKSLGNGATIQSSGYSLSPDYSYVQGKGQQFKGYSVRNRLRVSLEDPTAAGLIIDSASQAGVTEIGQVQFALADDRALRERALAEATKAALGRATVMASAVDLKVYRVLSIQDEQSPAVSFRQKSDVLRSSMASEAAPTEIVPGLVEIRAEVTVEVEVRP